jgi:hypothetical protein
MTPTIPMTPTTLRRTVLRLALLLAIAMSAVRPASAAETHAYVLTSDFSNGALSVIDLDHRAVTPDVATVYSDARIRWFGGLLYVVNRFGQDNIQVIDPGANYATLRQFSVGNGSNPQDIAFVSPTKAYVTRLGSPRLLIVNPATGDSLGAISLAAFADADGIPDMDRMIRVGSRLFVALERLANFQPTDASVVVAIDTQTDTVIDTDPSTPGVQPIALPGTNPTTVFDYDPASRRLIIGCTGRYQMLDGGIAWIDPATLASGGYAATESALGGDVLDVVWGSATRSFAIVSDAGFSTSLVAWNPTTGALLSPLFATSGFNLADVVLDDRGELYVCDNDPTAPGVYVLSAATGTTLAGPLAAGLPPVEVAFDQVANVIPTAVPPASLPVASGLTLAVPWPQPASVSVRSRLTLARAGAVTVDVLDVAGRVRRTLGATTWPAGGHDVTWDARDDAGHKMPTGIYFLRARAGRTTVSQRIVIAF